MPATLITLLHFSVSAARCFPKSDGEPANEMEPSLRKPSLELGIGEARVDFGVELIDYPAWCAFGRAYAIPSTRLIARQKIANSRDVW